MITLLVEKGPKPSRIHNVLSQLGHELVEATEKSAPSLFAKHSPMLVVIGPGLSTQESLNVARRIRALPHGKRTLYAAALDPAPASFDAFLEAGVDDFVVMTINDQALHARMAVLTRRAVLAAQRHDAEEVLEYRVALEKVITEISGLFIGIDSDETDRTVQRALKTVGEFSKVDRSYVFLLSADGEKISNTHEWCAHGIRPLIDGLQDMRVGDFPWGRDKLYGQEVIHIPRVADLPEAAAPERELLSAQGVKSVLIVPLMLGKTLLGLLGFDAARAEKSWADDDIRMLRLVGEIIAGAVERKRAEEALLQGEERFRRLVEHAADAFFVYDLDGRIRDVNQRACDSLGYTRGELLKKSINELEVNPILSRVAEQWKQELPSGPATVEGLHRRKDGGTFPVEARLALFESGGQTLTLALIRDITERKRADERLVRLNDIFLDLGPDVDQNIQKLTEACGELLGATAALYSRLEGDALHSAGRWNAPPGFNPRDKADGHICFDVIKRGRGAGVFQVRNLPATRYFETDPNVKPHGLKTYVGCAVSCFGESVGSLCTVYKHDVSFESGDRRLLQIFSAAIGIEEERRRAAEDLRASEERFRQLAESIREVFWLSDPEKNQMLYISPAYTEIWGRSTESLYEQPRSWLDAIHADDRERIRRALPKQPRGIYDEEYRIIRPDGSMRWIRDRAFPIRNAQGEIYRIAGIAEDITEFRRMENEVVEISGRERTRIGQDLHDGLGQQLTAIAFLTKALQERLARRGLPEASDINRILDLLEDTTVRTKDFGHELVPVNIETEGLFKALQGLARYAESVFRVPCDVTADLDVGRFDVGTQTHLFRIAQEAVTNAVKHGRPKHVSIHLGREGDRPVLTIEDDGAGVPEAGRPQGMGLRIMNYRAKAIGASLALRRREGGGTTVACSLPALQLP